MSRREADAAYARVAQARDAYYDRLALLARLTAGVNPEAMRMAKEGAHREFRTAIDAARVRSHVDRAATVWLNEINRINRTVREEQAQIKHEREEATRLDQELDRLTATAETSRTMAEAAEAACRAAQLGLVEPDELRAVVATGASTGPRTEPQAVEEAVERGPSNPEIDMPALAPAVAPSPATAAATGDPAGPSDGPSAPPEPAPELPPEPAPELPPEPAPEPKVDFGGSRPPTIARLLRRDRSAMNRLVDALAGADIDQRRRWQLLLSNFVDAVVATAIDSGCLEFPSGNRFWNQFDREQAREVARGLASLGFRYDGISQFADGHVPERRDLAVAVGQAGMHSVRVRNWPLPEENAGLMANVRVDTDLLLAEGAPSFTMGELLRLLGWRSEQLADLWNEWPRLRPLLLAPSPI
ncbi:MAG TPA: hypothetical protein VF361_00295 [Candidatus Limnocylindrales bacterium]